MFILARPYYLADAKCIELSTSIPIWNLSILLHICFFFLLRFRFFRLIFGGTILKCSIWLQTLCLCTHTHFGPNNSHTPQIFYANFLIYINIMYWMPIGSFSPEWKSMQILIRNWCYRAWRKLCRIWIYLNVWMCRRILWIELTKYRQFIQWL